MWKILIIWTSNCVPLMWDRTVSSYLCLFQFWSIYTRLLILIQWTAQFSASWKCKTPDCQRFNFHVNIYTDVDANKLKSLLHQFDLQLVNVRTHAHRWQYIGFSYIQRWYFSKGYTHRSISKIRPFCCLVYFIITISWITQANCDISQLEICRSWPITEGHWGCFFWVYLFWYRISCTQLYRCSRILLTNMHLRKHVW